MGVQTNEGLAANYENPSKPGVLSGLQAFARANCVALKRARKVLESNIAYTLHKPVRLRYPRTRVIVAGLDHQWEADLVDLQKLAKCNWGNQYLLTIIDVFTKKAWVQPVKNKTGTLTVKAIDAVLKRSKLCKPEQLQTDQSTELYNGPMNKWLQEKTFITFRPSTTAKTTSSSASIAR